MVLQLCQLKPLALAGLSSSAGEFPLKYEQRASMPSDSQHKNTYIKYMCENPSPAFISLLTISVYIQCTHL